MVEPLRDFNGYSWVCIPQEIESIDHNLIYQNLRILIGDSFLNKWIKNNEFIIDYFELFKESLANQYGEDNKNQIINLISEISILLNIKFNIDKESELNNTKEKIEEKLQEIQNKGKFIENKTKLKMDITDKIREIDTIISNKDLLQKEYEKRNEKLPLEKKIFSMRILSKIMEQEKEELLKKLENLNETLKPQNFIKYKNELEEKYKYLKILNTEDKENELSKLKINLQKLFIEMIKININKVETRQDIEKIIYDFRYYLLLPYDYEKNIQEISELTTSINEISEKIIDKAIDFKVIEKISNDKKTNYEILKNIFNVRIIKLEDAYLKVTKEKDKYFIQIFDENVFEENIEISKPESLEIKLNKKIAIWC